MKVVMLGTGYVGLVSGTCFAEMGNTVVCVDSEKDKIDRLNRGQVPIYEPGLELLIHNNMAQKRLSFSTFDSKALAEAEVIFICVGTPSCDDGSANLDAVWAAAHDIGRCIEGCTIVVTKSTVPVGATRKVEAIIREELAGRGSNAAFDMANNPEFLKEGNAIEDFMSPDRVVIGVDAEKAKDVMRHIYAPFFRTDTRIIFMSIPSSELTKYASNSMLATRISFMNEIAALAEKVGADVEEVRQGMARDKRIGKFFLFAGAGYGGSCFPKDVCALVNTGREHGVEMTIIRAVNEANRHQKKEIARKVLRYFQNDVRGKTLAVWGLAFKPETDDIRDAPSLDVIRMLRDAGAGFRVHDPEAMGNVRAAIGKHGIVYCEDSYEALGGADALIIMTEWKQYRTPDLVRMKELMKQPVVFDGRNLYVPADMCAQGFHYFGIGYGERV